MSTTNLGSRENPYKKGERNCYNHPNVAGNWLLVNKLHKAYYVNCDVCKRQYENYPDWSIEPYNPTVSNNEVKGDTKMIGVLFDATVVTTTNQLSANDGKPFAVKSEVVYSERGVYAQDLIVGKALVLARAIEQKKLTVTNDLTQTIEVKVVQYQ